MNEVSEIVSPSNTLTWICAHDSPAGAPAIARVAFRLSAGGLRATIPLPSAESVLAGRVYVIWFDCYLEPTWPASDIVLSSSTNGKAWSKLTGIPVNPDRQRVDHFIFIPGLAVCRSRSGVMAHLVVTFYYSRIQTA